MRNLVVILGDQLNDDSAALDGFDKDRDALWMAEVADEATHVWSHKARIAIFLAAMRHFRDRQRDLGRKVLYRQLDDNGRRPEGFAGRLKQTVEKDRPERIVLVKPGEWRVGELFQATASELGVPLDMRKDRHFLCSREEFAEHAAGRKQLRLEYFYRELRRKHDILMEGDQPTGGEWNYDQENRKSFSKSGPQDVPPPARFEPDETTRQVLELVEAEFANHPGQLNYFDWPVTPDEASAALDDFIERRLPNFGEHQDALWTDEPYLYHSRLSTAMNLKLLDPRNAIAAAEDAYRAGRAPLNAVEGFIRQILGWREYVRGVYWRFMPEYLDRNALDADRELPAFYWTGETDMHCLEQAIGQTLRYGYAHHIQRLMITGLFAMLLGVRPQLVHEWYLAVYVDAVEWVELPNTLGMSQFADGGLMASKPYAASGNYIHKMSNYCGGCRYNYKAATGEDACPFTTLYWDFLQRNRKRLEGNRRMTMQLKNLERKNSGERAAISRAANKLRERLEV